MSVRDFDISHVPVILDLDGLPATGMTSKVGDSFAIQITDAGLSNVDEAVTTIFHEIGHVRSFRAFGHPGTEKAAEDYGRMMLEQFQRRNG